MNDWLYGDVKRHLVKDVGTIVSLALARLWKYARRQSWIADSVERVLILRKNQSVRAREVGTTEQ